jgi:hypothetical protein
MSSEKYTERLAKYTLFAVFFCIGAALCWYFSNILVYILTSVVVSLLARPIMNGMQRISLKGRHLPEWICCIFSCYHSDGSQLRDNNGISYSKQHRQRPFSRKHRKGGEQYFRTTSEPQRTAEKHISDPWKRLQD